jgi:hypothetical protein
VAGRVGDTGPEGPVGQTGDDGPTGPTGPESPAQQVWEYFYTPASGAAFAATSILPIWDGISQGSPGPMVGATRFQAPVSGLYRIDAVVYSGDLVNPNSLVLVSSIGVTGPQIALASAIAATGDDLRISSFVTLNAGDNVFFTAGILGLVIAGNTIPFEGKNHMLLVTRIGPIQV